MRRFPALTVVGAPYPKGSMIPGVTKDGRPFMRHEGDFELQRWIGKMIAAALEVWHRPNLAEPVAVTLAFTVPVPSIHYHEKDVDKLARAALDALQVARVYVDDKHVALLLVSKHRLGAQFPTPGVTIRLAILTDKEEVAEMTREYLADTGLGFSGALTVS